MAEVPRGIRNNNPGNIIHMDTIHWLGEGTPDGRYAVFSTRVLGLRALAKELLTYQTVHGCRTVREFITRWAPPNENNTEAYIEDVAKHLGVMPNEFVLLASDRLLSNFIRAIIWHENKAMPYSEDEINQAIQEARAP